LTCAGGDREHRWLPALAPALPLPIPVPLAKGEPDTGYPYSWSICQWLSGEPASAHRIADPIRFAVDLAREIWKAALDARWDGAESWFHGDVAEGKLLLTDGHLAAVIDFGTCGVGDPACDLAIAWTLLTAEGRQAFRQR